MCEYECEITGKKICCISCDKYLICLSRAERGIRWSIPVMNVPCKDIKNCKEKINIIWNHRLIQKIRKEINYERNTKSKKSTNRSIL